MVPKNRAGLSTHAAPCSPLTLKKSPTDLVEIPSQRGGCCTHHQKEMYGWTFVSNGHPSHPFAVTIDPTCHAPPCVLYVRIVLLSCFSQRNCVHVIQRIVVNPRTFNTARLHSPVPILIPFQIIHSYIMKRVACNVHESKFRTHIPRHLLRIDRQFLPYVLFKRCPPPSPHLLYLCVCISR